MNDERFRRKDIAREPQRSGRRKFVPAQELAKALEDVGPIDYEQLRADIDAVVDQDPTPRHWVD